MHARSPGMNLTCPKCTSEMRSYERNRILVDQCTGCGGLFLDKGELEKLAAAENAWHDQPVLAPSAARPSVQDDRPRFDDRPRDDDRPRADDRSRVQDRPRYDEKPGYYDDRQRYDEKPGYYDDRQRYDDRHGGSYGKPRKKKKSFLSELFDD